MEVDTDEYLSVLCAFYGKIMKLDILFHVRNGATQKYHVFQLESKMAASGHIENYYCAWF